MTNMQMTTHSQYGDGKYNFQMADVRFAKPEVVISQPCTEVFYRNLVWT